MQLDLKLTVEPRIRGIPSGKDKFIAKIKMVDGKSVVTWTPDLNEDGTKSVRTYKTWGKVSLDVDEWLEVTPENQDDMRFFKVTVGMPSVP